MTFRGICGPHVLWVLVLVKSCGASCAEAPDPLGRLHFLVKKTGYRGFSEDVGVRLGVDIPSPARSVAQSAFARCTFLKEVELESRFYADNNGLVEIRRQDYFILENAFAECTSLRSVGFGRGLIAIDIHAFSGCQRLQELVLPSTLQAIGAGAFSGCTSLASMRFESASTRVAWTAFPSCLGYGVFLSNDALNGPHGNVSCLPCFGHRELRLPEGVVALGEDAFADCTSVQSVVMPSSVSVLGSGSFGRCSNLRNINIPADCDVDDSAFDGAPCGTNYSAGVVLINCIPRSQSLLSTTSTQTTTTLILPSSQTFVAPSGAPTFLPMSNPTPASTHTARPVASPTLTPSASPPVSPTVARSEAPTAVPGVWTPPAASTARPTPETSTPLSTRGPSLDSAASTTPISATSALPLNRSWTPRPTLLRTATTATLSPQSFQDPAMADAGVLLTKVWAPIVAAVCLGTFAGMIFCHRRSRRSRLLQTRLQQENLASEQNEQPSPSSWQECWMPWGPWGDSFLYRPQSPQNPSSPPSPPRNPTLSSPPRPSSHSSPPGNSSLSSTPIPSSPSSLRKLKVFISFRCDESTNVFRLLFSVCEAVGLETFNSPTDISKATIPVFVRKVQNADLVFVVLSPKYFYSKYCCAEARAATAANKVIVPVYDGNANSFNMEHTDDPTNVLAWRNEETKFSDQKLRNAIYKINVVKVLDDCDQGHAINNLLCQTGRALQNHGWTQVTHL